MEDWKCDKDLFVLGGFVGGVSLNLNHLFFFILFELWKPRKGPITITAAMATLPPASKCSRDLVRGVRSVNWMYKIYIWIYITPVLSPKKESIANTTNLGVHLLLQHPGPVWVSRSQGKVNKKKQLRLNCHSKSSSLIFNQIFGGNSSPSSPPPVPDGSNFIFKAHA